jgi:hypothetical protein
VSLAGFALPATALVADERVKPHLHRLHALD